MIIRSFEPQDLEHCARIHHASRIESERGIIYDTDLDRQSVVDIAQQWVEWCKNDETEIIVAEMDGHIVGVCMYGRIKTRPEFDRGVVPKYGAEIYALYVDPRHFRQGIGQALFHKACEDLTDQKLTSMILWTLKKNKRACGFYESLGGQKIGKKRVDMGVQSYAEESCFGWLDIRQINAS